MNPLVHPAKRLTLVKEYYFSRKGIEVQKMNDAGLDVISLAIGSPDNPPSQESIAVLAQEAAKANTHGYQPTKGTPELRQAMAHFYQRWYGVALDADSEVLPLIGSKEGILHVTLAFVNPGDKVLVPNPGYPTYTSLSRLLGAEVVHYDLKPENDWQPDFEALESMNLEGVKLLWTNYPHMPTGAKAQRKTYEKLVDFAKRKGIVVVNDNPYSFVLNAHFNEGGELLSILQIPGAKDCCIEFNSLSKSHNMPGWRVGMLSTNAEWTQWILKVKSNIDSGTFRPLQLAAAYALNENTEEWHKTFNYEVYAQRRRVACQIMDALVCTYDPSAVGMFLWGRIPAHYDNAETLTEAVLHNARVFITPGFIFGSNGTRYIRISLCAPKTRLEEALQRIKKAQETGML